MAHSEYVVWTTGESKLVVRELYTVPAPISECDLRLRLAPRQRRPLDTQVTAFGKSHID